jgi:chromosome segregation ATPase
MKTSYWTGITVLALIAGFILGYAMWGPTAARLPGAEQALGTAQAQVGDLKKKLAETEANLGKVMNERLSLERQTEELKETLEKATKKRR